jgi:hypothetical protein
MLNVHMHRLTARLLLIVIALGIFQPLLEAFSAEPPHPAVSADCTALPTAPLISRRRRNLTALAALR